MFKKHTELKDGVQPSTPKKHKTVQQYKKHNKQCSTKTNKTLNKNTKPQNTKV